ncbi:MAG: SDR family oxidoreductase [Pseudomonadota bacterium]|nr:SDR family oxidoreductase [Pseudomonadota bacterium]
MKIKDSVVLVTGANRGLGHAFVLALLAGGAKKVYAGARDPASVTVAGAHAVKLDVTSPVDVAAAVAACPDVTLLINNAGIARGGPLLSPAGIDDLRAEMETNFFGMLSMSQAFAPVLRANGGGAIVNVLSVLSWISSPLFATYCTTKSAAWSLTNGLRNELRGQGTQVVALHVGLMDTDLTRHIAAPKVQTADVVRQTIEVIEAGGDEVLADEFSRQVKQGLSAPRGVYLGDSRK